MIECEDVLQRRVTIVPGLWAAHVLVRRPWMQGWETEVERVLTSPDRIMFDGNFDNRECFYRVRTPLNPKTFLKVVVEFDTENNGTVVTAFPTHSISRMERQKWP